MNKEVLNIKANYEKPRAKLINPLLRNSYTTSYDATSRKK